MPSLFASPFFRTATLEKLDFYGNMAVDSLHLRRPGGLECHLLCHPWPCEPRLLLLALVTLLKFALHMSNYNFMGNYHYMAYFVTMAFLFVGHKKHLIKYLIVSFYIAAGALKMNMDWLSGAAMIRTPWLNGPLLSVSLFYVVLLELVLVAGLLHRRQSVRIFVLIQLLAFHIFSWHIVGFYYPMVMFSLLSLFVMDEWSAWRTSSHSLTLLTDIHQGKSAENTLCRSCYFLDLPSDPLRSCLGCLYIRSG
jgi:hypothetical protein